MSVHTRARRIRGDARKSVKSQAKKKTKEKSVPWREAYKDEIEKYSEGGLMLRGSRHKESLTQKQLADALGISQHHISEMENGKRTISKQMAQKLGEFFHSNYRKFL
jgi:DNA-binding XRE family transcriptional regulator